MRGTAALDVRSCFAANRGVRLHYLVQGTGPLLFFLHGIPDFSGGWRHQMSMLGNRYRVAAMDLRGFNLSDKPPSAESYRIAELVADVLAVMRALNADRATLIGHDWGAIIAWWAATLYPQAIEGVAVLSAPHPLCYLAARDANDLEYPPVFSEQILAARPGDRLDSNRLSAWVNDDFGRAQLAAALDRSDPESIRNFYRANLPAARTSLAAVPKVKAPVLIMYGAADRFIPRRYYDLSAGYAEGPTEIIAIPDAGHFIHNEAAEEVTAHIARWLDSRVSTHKIAHARR